MSENDVLDVVRKKMLGLLEAGKTINEWSKERPADWDPGSVTNPDPSVNIPFTHKTCWYFIEQLLRNAYSD